MTRQHAGMNTPAQRLRDEADAIRTYIDSRHSPGLVWQRLGSAERGLRYAAELFEQQHTPLLALRALCARLAEGAPLHELTAQDVADLSAAMMELDAILGAGRRCVHGRENIPEFRRTSGQTLCEHCNKPYWQHPEHRYTDGEGDPAPLVLTRNCAGEFLKL